MLLQAVNMKSDADKMIRNCYKSRSGVSAFVNKVCKFEKFSYLYMYTEYKQYQKAL